MTDREKLIKLLCEANSKSVDAELFEDSSYAQQLEMEADHLIANGVTIQKWIPVTERLPEKDGCYIVHCCDEYASEGIWHEPHVIMEAMFAFGEWSWEETTTEYDITPFVTHWMPLPEPPKEVE